MRVRWLVVLLVVPPATAFFIALAQGVGQVTERLPYARQPCSIRLRREGLGEKRPSRTTTVMMEHFLRNYYVMS